jgi:hypothetical protein
MLANLLRARWPSQLHTVFRLTHVHEPQPQLELAGDIHGVGGDHCGADLGLHLWDSSHCLLRIGRPEDADVHLRAQGKRRSAPGPSQEVQE